MLVYDTLGVSASPPTPTEISMSRRVPSRRIQILAACSLLAAAFLVTGCATNPATGRRQLSLVSQSRELQIGRESDPAVIVEYGLYGDSTVQRYVDTIGQKLAHVSHLPGLAWHFRVLDSPVVNAFAIPGGYIYITRGILAYLNSEAQLAGVLGHEIGHVTARHSAQQMTRSEIAGVGLLVGSLVSSTIRSYSGLAQQGLGLLFLSYSRDNETQADELGIEYATRTGFDPRQIPPTYAMLKRISERQGDRLPGFLSTHPDPGDREIRTNQLAQAAVGANRRDLLVNAPEYRRRIEGLVFGDDPRAGYFEANRFYHPDLGIQMIFPDGWKTQNLPSAVVASSEPLGAGMQLAIDDAPDSNATPEQFVQSLRAGNKILDYAGRPESFRDFQAWVGSILVEGQGGKSELVACFARYKPGQFLVVLGQVRSVNDQAADLIRASMRSLARLRDPEKLSVTADRVRSVNVRQGDIFSNVVASLGPQALSVEDTAILNNLRAASSVPSGTSIKIVQKGKHP